MSGPLGHLRVVEMATAIQGPAAGMFLSDMGAEVIKVEPPWGEVSRYYRGANNSLPPEALGSQFVAMNRGKQSVCLDIHTELGLRAVHRLLASTDVFVSNFRETALVKMGLGYAEVKALNPKIIYGHVSGYGPRGPDADKTMLDGAAIARGGLASVTGTVETGPIAPGATTADTAGAMQLALAIMTALVARARDGYGQKVRTSALGAQLWLQQWELTHVWMTGTMLRRSGAHHGAIQGPYGIYETADGGHFLFAVASDEGWDRFWLFVDNPPEALNPKWDTAAKRLGSFASAQEAGEIQQRMREAFKTKTTEEWRTFLATQPEIVYERVQNYDEVRTDPQVLANEYTKRVHLEHIGETTIVGNLISFSETPAEVEGVLPGLGIDTETVLRELGFSSDESESVIRHATAEREKLFSALSNSNQ